MNLLNKVVVCVSAANPNDKIHVGEAVSYLGEPSYYVKKDGDTRGFHWAESITREATLEEQVEYWRKRAEDAERPF
jgi:hypothetical protein